MAISGLKGAEHIGLTVPDLDQAVDFFANVLGAEELFEVGPYQSSDDWMLKNLGVDPRATIPRIKMLKVKDGPTFELFEYDAPDQSEIMPRNSDYGGHHIAFYVEDMAKALRDLKAFGLRVLGEPKYMEDGPSAGLSWVYFLSPWGLQMELVSYPNGLAAYRDT